MKVTHWKVPYYYENTLHTIHLSSLSSILLKEHLIYGKLRNAMSLHVTWPGTNQIIYYYPSLLLSTVLSDVKSMNIFAFTLGTRPGHC